MLSLSKDIQIQVMSDITVSPAYWKLFDRNLDTPGLLKK